MATKIKEDNNITTADEVKRKVTSTVLNLSSEKTRTIDKIMGTISKTGLLNKPQIGRLEAQISAALNTFEEKVYNSIIELGNEIWKATEK